MTDDRIGEALRALPTETAGDGFTVRVLRRLDQPPATPPRWRAALAGGAALAAAAAAAAWLVVTPPGPPAPAAGDGARITVAEAPQTGGEAPVAGAQITPDAEDAAALPRTGTEPTPRARAPRPVAPSVLPATTAAAAAPAAGGRRSELARMRTELASLRREHRRFAAELSAIPEVDRDGSLVVYVGGDEGLDLVLELGQEEPAPRPAVGSHQG